MKNLNRNPGLSKSDFSFLLNPSFTLIDSTTLISGVLTGYRPISKNTIFYAPWTLKTCHNTQQDLTYLYSLINNKKLNGAAFEYFIMDAFGNILYSNCEISNVVDNHGIIHVSTHDSSLDQFIYPAPLKECNYKFYYCHGKTPNGLNAQINQLYDQRIIEKPSLLKHVSSKVQAKFTQYTQKEF